MSHVSKWLKLKRGLWETPIYSLSVRRTGDNLDLLLASEVGGDIMKLSPWPAGSNAVSRQTVSKLRSIIGHSAGVAENSWVVWGKASPTAYNWSGSVLGGRVWEQRRYSFSFSIPLRDIPVSHLSSQPIKTKKAAVELSINFITMKLILENRDYSQEAELLILSPRVVQTGYNPRQP